MQLVIPKRQHLESYVAALMAGWTFSERGTEAIVEELQKINTDPDAFLACMEDRKALGPSIKLPDGSEVKRLPSIIRWIWDGAFCGRIDLRWQEGTNALPPHCLGHIGYAVVPWKQGQGFATRALHGLLPEAWAIGLEYVEITTNPANIPSQRVIKANGGILHEEFVQPPQFGSKPGLRFRIHGPGNRGQLKGATAKWARLD